jgi:uncharacterized cupin superfamily protein
MPRVAIPPFTQDPGAPHPVLGAAPGPYAHAVIGDAGGLTQFGCHLERLPPGSRSAHRHWHETEDEMVYILEGEVVLVEDTETLLRAGEAAAWPAGRAIGHCLENRSEADALYLVVGTRRMADVVHYPDAGVTLSITDRTHRVYTDATGTVLSQGAGAVPQKETQT